MQEIRGNSQFNTGKSKKPTYVNHRADDGKTPNADVFSEVVDYLNQREFLRAQKTAGPLFIHYDRIKARYASFELDSTFQPVFDWQ